jgi:cardiolipin synthase
MATRWGRRLLPFLASGILLSCLSGCAASLPNARTLFQKIRRETQEAPEDASTSRRTRIALARLRAQGYLTARMERHLRLIRAIAGVPLTGGNKVTLLQNGKVIYAAMERIIAHAKNSINLETFTFADDAVGRKFASLLIDRSRAGVRVNVIYDTFGSLDTPASFFDRMRRNGISVVAFNPLTGSNSGPAHDSMTHRDHRKVLVVDGRIAITGSVNIANEYANSRMKGFSTDALPTNKMFWRDTDVEIEGPAVAQCQRLFVAEWYGQTGKLLPPANYFPHLKAQGDQLVQVIGSTPQVGFSTIYYALIAAIQNAQRNVYIEDAYFAPGRQFLDILKAAARRGVNVQLILPHRTDHPIVLHAAQWHYGALLRSHVRIYERRHALLHSKTATIDNIWSTVGSSNLDWWSIARDNEINVVIVGHQFALQMDAAFADDREQSLHITRAVWSERSLTTRVDELCGWLVQRWL